MLILQAPQCHCLTLLVDSKYEGLWYHNSASGNIRVTLSRGNVA